MGLAGCTNPSLQFVYAIKDSVHEALSKVRKSASVWQLQPVDGSTMMGYILLTSRNKVIVIDGGSANEAMYVQIFLKLLGGRVSAWYITHPHQDHAGALATLLSEGTDVQIDRIYASFPDRDWLEALPEDETSTLVIYDLFAKARASITEASLGQVHSYDEVSIEILSVKNPEITTNGVNNSSMVLRVADPGKSFVFLGDLGREEWIKLSTTPSCGRLKADYVQVAHHGSSNGIEALYRRIAPSFGLWPTTYAEVNGGSGYPAAVTQSEQSLLNLFRQIGVTKNYFSFDQLYRID